MSSISGTKVHIDASSIPDGEYDVACSVLASSIRLALQNEELRREFEKWKAERKEVENGHRVGDRR